MTPPLALVRFAEEELAKAPALVDRILQALVGTLTQPNDSLPTQERIAAADLAQTLARQRPRMVAAYSTTLRDGAAAHLMSAADDAAPKAATAGKPRKLALVDEQAVSADVEIARATQAILTVADHELRELASFLSTLAGNPTVVRDHNPLRPETHARALWAAALALTDDHAAQALFMRMANAPLAQALRKSYAASCSRLEEAGIEPAAYRTVILPAGLRTERAGPVTDGPVGTTAVQPAPATSSPRTPAQADAPVLHDLARTLTTLATTLAANMPPMHRAPGAALPATPTQPDPLASRAGALSRSGASTLTGSESRPLAGIAPAPGPTSAPATTSTPTTAAAPLPTITGTLPLARQPEFLQRIFEAVTADRRLAADVKPLIVKLQPLVTQLAASDASLVESDDHPAWRFIDRIAWQAEVLAEAPDRERVRTVQVIDGVIAELQRDAAPDASRFAWAAERVAALERSRFERRLARQSSRTAALAAAELQLATADARGALDVGALSTVPSQLYDAAPQDAADTPSPAKAWLDERQPGDVVRLFLQARWVHAQLLWVGTGREVWLWADCRADETWPFRRGALRVLRDEGLAQVARPRSLLRDAAIRLDAQARRRQAA